MVGRDVDDALDVGLLLEHLAVVFVGANPSRTLLLLVVGLHDLAGDFTSAANPFVARAPIGFLQKLSNLVAVAKLAPIDIVLAVAVGIDDRNELDVGAAHEPRVHLALRLQSAADLCQANHVARGDEPLAAEHTPWNDGESRRSGEPGQECSAIDVSHGGVSG